MIDREQIAKWWSIFHEDGEVTEIRTVGKVTYSGYYKDFSNVIRDIEYIDKTLSEPVYFILNAINEGCYGRDQKEKLVKYPKHTTNNKEIVGRKWLMIDLDPKRISGTNSTNEELEYAHQKAIEVYRFLKDQGYYDPVVCMSGNGYHLMYRCHLAVSEETDKLVENFLNVLSMLFTDDKVDVDTACKNTARLSKVYGTLSAKGANTEDRPSRISRIVKVPDEIKINGVDYIKRVVDLLPEEKPQPSVDNNWGNEKFDVEAFLNKHGLEYKKEPYHNGTKYVLKHCVFNENHKGKDACVIQNAAGGLSYVCLHASCSNFKWKDFRMKFEPNCYDKKDYTEFKQKIRYNQPHAPQPYKVIEEDEEKGKKWLSPKDIKRIKEEDIIAIPTGYSYLDKAIRGFVLGEVTILSGLNGSGKSSWLNSVMLNVIQHGFKVALFSGELTDYKVMQWLSQSAAGRNNVHRVEDKENVYDTNDMCYAKIVDWLDGKFYLFNNNYGNNFTQILSDLQEIVEKGVQLIVLDNLMALQISSFSGDRNEKQKQFILEVVEFAKEKQVHVVVVCHPRKESGSQTLLRKESIAGSSDLSNAVQNVMIVHRRGEDFAKRASEFFGKEKTEKYLEYDNVVEVCKNRSYGIVDYLVGMYYEMESRRFKNYKAEHLVYAWEETPTQVSLPIQDEFKTTDFEESYNPFGDDDDSMPW